MNCFYVAFRKTTLPDHCISDEHGPCCTRRGQRRGIGAAVRKCRRIIRLCLRVDRRRTSVRFDKVGIWRVRFAQALVPRAIVRHSRSTRSGGAAA